MYGWTCEQSASCEHSVCQRKETFLEMERQASIYFDYTQLGEEPLRSNLQVGKDLAKVYSSQYLFNQYLLSIKYVLDIQFQEQETLYSYKQSSQLREKDTKQIRCAEWQCVYERDSVGFVIETDFEGLSELLFQ